MRRRAAVVDGACARSPQVSKDTAKKLISASDENIDWIWQRTHWLDGQYGNDRSQVVNSTRNYLFRLPRRGISLVQLQAAKSAFQAWLWAYLEHSRALMPFRGWVACTSAARGADGSLPSCIDQRRCQSQDKSRRSTCVVFIGRWQAHSLTSG